MLALNDSQIYGFITKIMEIFSGKSQYEENDLHFMDSLLEFLRHESCDFRSKMSIIFQSRVHCKKTFSRV